MYHVHEAVFVPTFQILTPTTQENTFPTKDLAEAAARKIAEGWTVDEKPVRFLLPLLGCPCVCYQGESDFGAIILHY